MKKQGLWLNPGFKPKVPPPHSSSPLSSHSRGRGLVSGTPFYPAWESLRQSKRVGFSCQLN